MTSLADERKDSNTQDVQEGEVAFAKHLAKLYAPAPLTANQRAAFNMGLEARLEKRRQYTFFVPAFATVAAASAVLIFALNGGMNLNPQTRSMGTAEIIVAEAPIESETMSVDSLARDEWAYDLLAFNDPLTYAAESHELSELDKAKEAASRYAFEESATDMFPELYLAIENVFLEG